MDLPQRYKGHCSTSPCRSAFDSATLKPFSQRRSSSSSWTSSNTISSFHSPIPSGSVTSPVMPSSCRDPLRNIHHSPKITKTTHHQRSAPYNRHGNRIRSTSPYTDWGQSPASAPFHHTSANAEDMTPHDRQYHRQLSPTHTRLRSCSPPSPAARSSSGPRSSSGAQGPRSNDRLPSLFAQLKAKLEAPRRPIITTIYTSPLSPSSTYLSSSQDGYPHSATPLSPLHPYQPIQDDDPYTGSQPWPPLASSPPPTLFGTPCSAASQRAYLNHNPDVEKSFRRLQLEDNGRVEHRTIAFSTHLTISRWEPSSASSTSTSSAGSTAPVAEDARVEAGKSRSDISTGSFRGSITSPAQSPRSISYPSSPRSPSSPKQQKQQQQQQMQQMQQGQENDLVYATRLLSLANYIRHIISLSSGNNPLHSQLTMAQQQQQRQQQKIQDCRPMPFVSNTQFSNEVHEGPGSLPSPLSAGPGPIKSGSLSTRRHRYASEYHDHQTRRHLHHQQQQQQQAQNLTQGRYETEHQLPKPLSSQGQPQNTLLEPSGTQAHRLPSPISPTFVSGRRLSQQQQQQQQHNISPVSPRNVTGVFSPLLKVPFPNLTLTLALIYVDRLKAKYPEAKGEAGCSHRLFLVAYIIAEKYRCSVELATLLQEHHNHLTELELRGRDQSHTSSLENTTGPELDDAIEERILKVQSNAELIFSNHEWVRLLNLGSFFRPPPAPTASMPSSAAKATAGNMAGVARTSPAQPMVRSMPCPSGSIESEPLPLPIQSSPAVAVPGDTNTVTAANHNSVKNASLPSPAPSSAGTQGGTPMPTPKALPLQVPQTSILQVEDLDRMETEFLTFLDFDLSTRGQDLDTCWNLLVGNIQI